MAFENLEHSALCNQQWLTTTSIPSGVVTHMTNRSDKSLNSTFFYNFQSFDIAINHVQT